MFAGVWKTGEDFDLKNLMSREAPVRACFSDTPRNYNFEIKAIDGTANPYLALSAILAAGMLGVKSSSSLGVKSCLGMNYQTFAKSRRSWNYE